jgi:hypothetical protein
MWLLELPNLPKTLQQSSTKWQRIMTQGAAASVVVDMLMDTGVASPLVVFPSSSS